MADRSMLRAALIVATALLIAAGPARGADPAPTTVPSVPPSPTASSAVPATDGLPASALDVFADSPVTTVSLGLYSGLPDPSWELSDEQSAALTAILGTLPRVDGSAPTGGLGYHGFWIEWQTPEGMPRLLVAFAGAVSDPASSHLSYLSDPERSVERFLLESGRDRLSALEVMATGLGPDPVPTAGS